MWFMVHTKFTADLLLQVDRWAQRQLVLQHDKAKHACRRSGSIKEWMHHRRRYTQGEDVSSTTHLFLLLASSSLKATSIAAVFSFTSVVHNILQDALTKTVPVWAAVLNRAVAQLRSYHDSSKLSRDGAFLLLPQSKRINSMLNLRSTSPGTIMAARASHRQQATLAKVASSEQDWDTSLHLPPWVSSNERLQIEAKLDQWVRDLCQVTLLQPAVA